MDSGKGNFSFGFRDSDIAHGAEWRSRGLLLMLGIHPLIYFGSLYVHEDLRQSSSCREQKTRWLSSRSPSASDAEWPQRPSRNSLHSCYIPIPSDVSCTFGLCSALSLGIDRFKIELAYVARKLRSRARISLTTFNGRLRVT